MATSKSRATSRVDIKWSLLVHAIVNPREAAIKTEAKLLMLA
jgi:hypothetical protein